MIIGCWFICVFVLVKNICTADRVFPQVNAEGVIGGFATLPCASSKNEHILQDINVLWKYKNSMNVYAIIKGSGTVEHQNLKYKNRVGPVFEDYKNGDFTLKLNNLTNIDEGLYQCYITHSDELVTVMLLVKESPEEKPSHEEKPSDVEREKRTIIIPVICVSLFIVIVLCIIIACVVKRGYKTSSSGVSATGECLSCPVGFKQISNTPEPTYQNQQDYAGLPSNI